MHQCIESISLIVAADNATGHPVPIADTVDAWVKQGEHHVIVSEAAIGIDAVAPC